MSSSNQTIHLGIAFDNNYSRHFYALFTSILKNNKANSIHVHAIITGVAAEEQKRIEKYAVENHASVSFYEIDEAYVQSFVLTSTWSSAVYYRLFFPLIVPEEVTRLLYLDTDMIVVGDLASLYAMSFDGYPLAAVYDNWVKTAPQLGICEEGNYFNSGMMLINIPEWKEQKISEKVFRYLEDHPGNIRFVDQCGLNAVLVNNWKKLDFRFNVLRSYIPENMSNDERAGFLKDKIIIHYTLDRPWKMLCRNPYRDLYYRYLHQSPFKLEKKYEDFSMDKVPGFLRIKLLEFYHNLTVVKQVWRRIKLVIR